MKFKLLLCMLLFIETAKCYAQNGMDTDGLNNLNNVYLYSLKEYCSFSLNSSKNKIIYVKREYFVGDSWPKEINGYKIIYLESFQYKKTIKENGGNITLVGISPLGLEKGNFYITVLPFSASYKEKEVHLINGGALTVNFQYDPEKKWLIYKSKIWSGI